MKKKIEWNFHVLRCGYAGGLRKPKQRQQITGRYEHKEKLLPAGVDEKKHPNTPESYDAVMEKADQKGVLLPSGIVNQLRKKKDNKKGGEAEEKLLPPDVEPENK